MLAQMRRRYRLWIATGIIAAVCSLAVGVAVWEWCFIKPIGLAEILGGQPVQLGMRGMNGDEWTVSIEPDEVEYATLRDWLREKEAATWHPQYVSVLPGLEIRCEGGTMSFPRGSRNPITFVGQLRETRGRIFCFAEREDVTLANEFIAYGRGKYLDKPK